MSDSTILPLFQRFPKTTARIAHNGQELKTRYKLNFLDDEAGFSFVDDPTNYQTLVTIGSKYSVKNYGAVGDGTTDDTAAIVACLAEMGSAYFPPGTYLITSTISLPANAVIWGEWGLSTVKGNSASVNALFTLNSNTSVKSLILDGLYTTYPGTGEPPYVHGLLEFKNTTTTVVEKIRIDRVWFKNCRDAGIRIDGYVRYIAVTRCEFDYYGTGIVGYPDNTNYKSQEFWLVSECRFGEGYTFATGGTYGTGQSGGIKIQGRPHDSAGTIIGPHHIRVENNSFEKCGQMGVEVWKQNKHTIITGNDIKSCAFGISIDDGQYCVVANNNVSLCTYVAVEAVLLTNATIVVGNVLDGYAADGVTPTCYHGVIASNQPGAFRNLIENNMIVGMYNSGVKWQDADHGLTQGNTFINCAVPVNIQNASYHTIKNNYIMGECTFFFVIDSTSRDTTDFDFEGNFLFGEATGDGFFIYNNRGSHTISNLRIRNNNAWNATHNSLSVNRYINDPELINYQVTGNNFIDDGIPEGSAGSVKLPDFLLNADVPEYSSTIQHAGLSVSAKTVLSIPVSASTKWFKIFDITLGVPIALELHIGTEGVLPDNKGMAATFLIGASPYEQTSKISMVGGTRYNDQLVTEIIYNNPTGAEQEVWIKVEPVATTAGTISLWFSDYKDGVIATPTAVTTEPTWATASYRLKTAEAGEQMTDQTRFLLTRDAIGSAARGAITSWGARLHTKGAYNGWMTRIEHDTGALCQGVKSTGSNVLGLPLVTTATEGFPYIPIINNTPTGTPESISTHAPLVVDTAANKLWVYVNGAWKYATLT